MESELTDLDTQMARKLGIFGLAIVGSLLIIFVIIFGAVRSSPNSVSSSFYDGQQSASQVAVSPGADRSVVRSACRSFYAQGLPGDDVGDQETPFVDGCVQAIEAKAAHP